MEVWRSGWGGGAGCRVGCRDSGSWRVQITWASFAHRAAANHPRRALVRAVPGQADETWDFEHLFTEVKSQLQLDQEEEVCACSMI